MKYWPETTLSFLLFFTFILYWPGLYGPFLLDDLQTIEMARVQVFHWNDWLSKIVSNDAGPLRRPISILSFILTNFFFGDSPFAYKCINVIIHLLNSVLVYVLLQNLLPYFSKNSLQQNTWISIAITAFWTIHPLQVSTVLYTVQRMMLLSSFFFLLSLLCYVKFRLELGSKKTKIFLFFSMLTSWILAIFSKENALLLPGILLAFEMLCYQTPQRSKVFILGSSIICFVLVLGGLAYYVNQYPTYALSFAEKGFTLPHYIFLQMQVLVFYLKLIVTPSLGLMGLYHDDFQLTQGTPIWLSVGILLLLCVIAIGFLKRYALLSFFIFWFFMHHSLESSILPLEPVFEHRNYLASLGIIAAPILFLVWKFQTKHARIALQVFGGSGILLIASLTWARVESFSSSEKFLIEAHYAHPLSSRTHIEWANFLFAQNEFGMALMALNRAHQLNPHNSGPLVHQFLTHCFIQAPSDTIYQESVTALSETSITPYTILVLDALVQNHFNHVCPNIPLSKSLTLIHAAIKNPLLEHKPSYRATLFHLQAGLLLLNQEPDKAIFALEQSFQLNPNRVQPLLEKIQLLINQGEYLRAKQALNFVKQNFDIFGDTLEKVQFLQHQITQKI
ncbi:MAG TPA: hypothetical protein VFP93_04230 [Gammaproteobacteria bacterium]|nr:hypothetical protein [Gammaproteobacteria bacterium]